MMKEQQKESECHNSANLNALTGLGNDHQGPLKEPRGDRPRGRSTQCPLGGFLLNTKDIDAASSFIGDSSDQGMC